MIRQKKEWAKKADTAKPWGKTVDGVETIYAGMDEIHDFGGANEQIILQPHANFRITNWSSIVDIAIILSYIGHKGPIMTTEEQNFADNKMRAEIEKITAETIKVGNETLKISKEVRWYELVITSGATLAIVAIVKLFL